MLKNIINYGTKVDSALKMYCDTSCRRLEGYAREHAPWKDRSGAARLRLNSSYQTTSTGYRLKLAHGVEYGIYLELSHEKRFAVIYPTIQYVGPNEIMPGLKALLNRLG